MTETPKLLTLTPCGKYGPNFYLYLCRRESLREETRREAEKEQEAKER